MLKVVRSGADLPDHGVVGTGHKPTLGPPEPGELGEVDSVHVAKELIVDPPALGLRRDRHVTANAEDAVREVVAVTGGTE